MKAVTEVLGDDILIFLKSFGGSPSEGHNTPHGSPRKFASQRVLRGLCKGLFEVSAGLCGVSAGLCGGPRGFLRVVTLSL